MKICSAVPPLTGDRIDLGQAPRPAGMMSAAWRRCAVRWRAVTRSFTYGRRADDVRWQIAVIEASGDDVRACAAPSGTATASAGTSKTSKRFTWNPPWSGLARVYGRPNEADSAAELELVPARHGSELEQGAAAVGIAVAEVGGVVVPGDLEQAFLDPVVEPGPPEHELPEPVHERLALDERDVVPVPDDVATEVAPRLFDPAVGRELDEVLDLLWVELVVADQPEPDRRGGDPLLEVVAVEAEPIAQELDDVVVPGRVVRFGHGRRIAATRLSPVTARAVAISAFACAILVVVGRYALDLAWDSALVLAPVFVLVVGAIAFLIVLWAKVIRDSLRGQGADQ